MGKEVTFDIMQLLVHTIAEISRLPPSDPRYETEVQDLVVRTMEDFVVNGTVDLRRRLIEAVKKTHLTVTEAERFVTTLNGAMEQRLFRLRADQANEQGQLDRYKGYLRDALRYCDALSAARDLAQYRANAAARKRGGARNSPSKQGSQAHGVVDPAMMSIKQQRCLANIRIGQELSMEDNVVKSGIPAAPPPRKDDTKVETLLRALLSTKPDTQEFEYKVTRLVDFAVPLYLIKIAKRDLHDKLSSIIDKPAYEAREFMAAFDRQLSMTVERDTLDDLTEDAQAGGRLGVFMAACRDVIRVNASRPNQFDRIWAPHYQPFLHDWRG